MTESESFGKAFARARRDGRKTFVWNGKTYGTKMKGEGTDNGKRTSTGGGGNDKGKAEDNRSRYKSDARPQYMSRSVSTEEYGEVGMPQQRNRRFPYGRPEDRADFTQYADDTRVYKPDAQQPVSMTPEYAEKLRKERTKGRFTSYERTVNQNPVFAVLDKKVRGMVGADANYTDDTALPYEHYRVLSDQNKWIWDNLGSVLQNDISKLQQAMSQPGVSKDRMESMNKTLQQKKRYLNMHSNGTLVDYMKLHPNEKVVVSGNFAHYKNANQGRFDKSVPDKYAKFGAEGYSDYAMNTPLGQVETIWGNNVQSFRYSPKTGRIQTAVSDSYDFGGYSDTRNESSSVGALRKRFGNDKDMGESSKGKVFRRYSLADIEPEGGKRPYISDKNEFGVVSDNEARKRMYDGAFDIAMGLYSIGK